MGGLALQETALAGKDLRMNTKGGSRVEEEMAHGMRIVDRAEEIWGWQGMAGASRWQRRVGMLTRDLDKSVRVLEVGCGIGLLTQDLAKTGCNVVAMDVSPHLLRRAMSRNLGKRVSFLHRNAMATGLPEGSFDFVIGSSILHHLETELALQEFSRLLRSGGTVRFTEPNMLNPQIMAQKNIPWLKRLAGDSPSETAFFRWSLARLLKREGFRNVSIEPFDFLHPATPDSFVEALGRLGMWLERNPALRQIAGSLFIEAEKS